MALVNWYPPGAPAWPPPGYSVLEFSGMPALESWALHAKYTGEADIDNPTVQERNNYFVPTRCNQGHQVTGRMVVIGGVRYPFCRCNDPQHNEFLVPWVPFSWGNL